MLIDKKIENLYDVFTFDVVPIEGAQIKIKTHHYFNCDLSVGIEKNKNDYEVEYLKNGKIIKCYFHSIFSISDLFSKMLEKNLIKKPDIIISSTLCQSFSNVLSMVGGGTCF
jgi:alanine dehydrogenase